MRPRLEKDGYSYGMHDLCIVLGSDSSLVGIDFSGLVYEGGA